MFPNVDDRALINNWPKVAEKVELKQKGHMYRLDIDMYKFFGLLEFLPTHKVKFDTAATGLIVFSDVSWKYCILMSPL